MFRLSSLVQDMLKNYLKTAWRNIRRNKLYSLINILGLAMGLAIFTLFAVIAGFDSEADKFHADGDRIFSLVQVYETANKGEEHSAYLPAPLLPALMDELPEIEAGARAFPAGRMIVKQDENIFYENNVLYADPDFLSVFSFALKTGNPQTVLAEPYSIVLSEKMANKYFGEINPIGKNLILDNKVNVTVTGIMENIDADYSSLQYDFLLSLETAKNFVNWMEDWNAKKLSIFMLLRDERDASQLESQLPAFVEKHIAQNQQAIKELYLLPLLDFRLHSTYIASFWVSSDSFTYFLMLFTGTLMLLIVSINFMNLSTARYMSRMKEVGLRKVIGAERKQLMKQFLSESVLMALLSLPLALALYDLLLSGILKYLVSYDGNFNIWNHPFIFKYLPVVTVLVGILSGAYPSFVLSSFNPAKILKGQRDSGKKGSRLRKILVVSQFSLAIFLIVITMAWKKQYDHLFEIDMGYNSEQIVTLKVTDELRPNMELFQNTLLRDTDVLSVSAAAALPGRWERQLPVVPQGKSEADAWTMRVYDIDYGFSETFNIQMIQGRSHDRNFSDTENFIVNETLARELLWDNPIGNQLTIEGKTGTVIGVAKDFNFRGVNNYITSTVLRLKPENCQHIIIKYSNRVSYEDIITSIREQWQTFVPNLPFEPYTLDAHIMEIHKGDRIFISIFSLVGFIAILISCLGLFGMVSYTVEKRTKEIGIRKTLGASVPKITGLLIKDFLILVAIANVIALPLAYYVMDTLLQYRLAYGKIEIGVGILLLTSFITLLAAVTAVITQTLKAARANPIIALKYE